MGSMKSFLVLLSLITSINLLSTSIAQNSYRDSWQEPERIMDSLHIEAGMVIGEAGAGEGYFTFHLAKRVGPKGKIYANDIKRDVLKEIERKCVKENIKNIVTIVGKEDHPLFPEGLDMVVMMRAFHHFKKPVDWMKNVMSSMKTGAKLVIIDLDPNKTGYGWHHFMTREEVLATMAKTDFKLIRVYTFLERDNIYVYGLHTSGNH
jgi:ubiquinone/menaquinone biosynthesis C-methylase UbiE